jgi:hypothetical protein
MVALALSMAIQEEALGDAAARHAVKLDHVVHQLRAHGGGRPLSFRKRAVGHTVPKRHDKRRTDDKIDLTPLDEIIAIDPEAMTCTAEPGVTFVDLVRATLRYQLVPTVVPELQTITIGGAVSGCSVESMSFQHGGFHDSCLEYEIVTAAGEVLHCTPDNEHALILPDDPRLVRDARDPLEAHVPPRARTALCARPVRDAPGPRLVQGVHLAALLRS